MGRVIIGKFGHALRGRKANTLAQEIAEERAGALGRAGRKLELALSRYRVRLAANAATKEIDALLDEVAESLWYLIVQRELVGFVHENLRYVREHYDIPAAAFARMGQSRPATASRGGRAD
jgi:DNA topoisomerase VI subunit B